jgi:hypothetical protein
MKAIRWRQTHATRCIGCSRAEVLSGMDITGDDHVIFSFENPHVAITQFILTFQRRWPHLSVDYTEPDFHQVYEGDRGAHDCGLAVKTREHSSLFFIAKSVCVSFMRKMGMRWTKTESAHLPCLFGSERTLSFSSAKLPK